MARKTLEQRIESVEASIASLTSTLESLTHLVQARIVKDDSENSHAQEELNHSWPDDRGPQRGGISPREAVYRGPDGALNSLGPSSALSVLAQASEDLALLKVHQASVNGRAAASSTLQDMSEYYVTNTVKENMVWVEMKRERKATDSFYVPEASKVQGLIDTFLDYIDLGYPIYLRPPTKLVSRLILEPQHVSEKGRVVIANCILASAVAYKEGHNTPLCRSLQGSTCLALDDATLFHDPNMTNIRALILVASHGQDLVIPKFCYSLVSNACRMAQSIGLHLPMSPARVEIIGEQQAKEQVSLFWSLHALDQSLSLMFGRRPILLRSDSESMPLPDDGLLRRIIPHLRKGSAENLKRNMRINSEGTVSLVSDYKDALRNFGAFSLLQDGR